MAGRVHRDASTEGSGRPAAVRIRDVAAEAGVSTTTVSHALSGRRTVGTETREKVLAAVKRLGYSPDARARGLRTGRTGVIAFVGDVVASTPFAGDLLRGVQQAARERDTAVLVAESEGDADYERGLMARAVSAAADGIVLARMYNQPVARPALPGGIPATLVNATAEPDWEPAAFAPDEAEIGRAAALTLLRAGHRRIGFVNTVDDSIATRARERGFRATLMGEGLVTPTERGASTATGGREAALRLFAAAPDLTAVFCFNDLIAMGVYQALAALGRSVPDDCSVLGVDDLRIVSEGLLPPLSTFALPHEQMGRWGAEALLDAIEAGTDPEPLTTLVRCTYVARGSVAAPPTEPPRGR